jgi:hypothetical protein
LLLGGQFAADGLYRYADRLNRASLHVSPTLREQVNSARKTLRGNTDPQIREAMTKKLKELEPQLRQQEWDSLLSAISENRYSP